MKRGLSIVKTHGTSDRHTPVTAGRTPIFTPDIGTSQYLQPSLNTPSALSASCCQTTESTRPLTSINPSIRFLIIGMDGLNRVDSWCATSEIKSL